MKFLLQANPGTEAVESVTSTSSGFLDMIKGLWSPEAGHFFIKLIIALAIFIVGRWVAKFIGKMVAKGLGKTSLDDKVAKMAGFDGRKVEAGLGKFVYYLLLLFVVVVLLDYLGMSQATEPLKEMLTRFFNYIPSLIGGCFLLFLTVFLARIVKNIVASLMQAGRVDERLGSKDGHPITTAVTNALFALIILLMLPTVMGVFNLPQISQHLSEVVSQITGALPGVLKALILVAIGYLIAKIGRDLVYNMLKAVGFNELPAKLGYRGEMGSGTKSPAGLVSALVMLSLMAVIIAEALNLMQLEFISGLSEGFLDGYFKILGALIIAAVAIFVSNLAHDFLLARGADRFATIAKYAILVFGGFIALQRSGISPELSGLPLQAAIIAAAFACGVGGAIAIGLGGREHASRWLGKWL